MKSKEEILQKVYTQGADGMPEITADSLLKAMNEYAEQAFDSARAVNGNGYQYAAFSDYITGIEQSKKIENSLADDLKLIADSILPQFIPQDGTDTALTFHIKTNGVNYKVHYIKNNSGYWEFKSYSRN